MVQLSIMCGWKWLSLVMIHLVEQKLDFLSGASLDNSDIYAGLVIPGV